MSDISPAEPAISLRPRATRDDLVLRVATLPDGALDQQVTWEGRACPLGEAVLSLAAHHRVCLPLEEALAAAGWQPSAAVWHLRRAPVSRARMEAALVGVPDALLDGTPFPGEWSVRQQLAHVELTDVRYTIATRYGVRRGDAEPISPPAALYPPRQASPSGTPGEPLAAILERMRRVRAEAIAPLLSIADEDLLRPVEWHTAEHTVGFRLHLFAHHDFELVADMQRTLAALGYRPIRAMRLASALVEAAGEIDAVLLGVPAAILESELVAGDSKTPRAVLEHLHAAEQWALDQVATR